MGGGGVWCHGASIAQYVNEITTLGIMFVNTFHINVNICYIPHNNMLTFVYFPLQQGSMQAFIPPLFTLFTVQAKTSDNF